MKWTSLTLRELFFVTVVVAFSIYCYMATAELNVVRKRLLRYGDQSTARRVLSGEFGIEAKTLVRSNDVVVLELLATSNKPFEASLRGDRGSKLGVGQSSKNPDSGYEELAFICTFDHLPTLQKLKYGVYGYTIKDVPTDFVLANKLQVVEGMSIAKSNTSRILFNFDHGDFFLQFSNTLNNDSH